MLLHLFATFARAGCAIAEDSVGGALLVRAQGLGEPCSRMWLLGPATVDRVWLEHEIGRAHV